MGIWGPDLFENDAALDWAAGLVQASNRAEFLRRTLHESEAWETILPAAAVIAAGIPRVGRSAAAAEAGRLRDLCAEYLDQEAGDEPVLDERGGFVRMKKVKPQAFAWKTLVITAALRQLAHEAVVRVLREGSGVVDWDDEERDAWVDGVRRLERLLAPVAEA
jgi:hypothetical protein